MAKSSHVDGAETLLREWLKTGDGRDGRRLPSERNLARQLGVQHYAMNRAMARLVAEGLVVREGYKLFSGSQKTIVAPTFTCHLVVAHRSIYLRSYQKVAEELGIEAIVHRYTTVEEVMAILHQLDSFQTEGVIFDPPFSGAPLWEKAMAQLSSHGVPAICIGNQSKGTNSILGDYPKALQIALNHLKDLGHREVALLSLPASTPTLLEVLKAWEILCPITGYRKSVKRVYIPDNSIVLRENITDLADRLNGEWKEVTALITYGDSYISHLLERLAKLKKHVPKDIALICLTDSPALRTSIPPITVVESDIGTLHETAYRMVQRLARKRNEPGLSHSCTIRIQPELILRASTATTVDPVAEPSPIDTARAAKPGKADADAEQNLEAALRQPYPLVARAESSRFVQLNLESKMNRPLNFRRGWLGDLPLKHFAPGEHIIHGVPFGILGGPHRSDCGAIVFHSSINTRGNAQELPTRLEIPIKAKAKAIYILHGCGYARFLKPFAIYRFFQGRKQIDQISLVPLGQPPASYEPGKISPDFLKANIQDWWPDLPHINFPHGRMAPINESESTDPVQRHVYLYTMEWINPFPDKPIHHLEIEVDPLQSTTLGVLAVSLLKSA